MDASNLLIPQESVSIERLLQIVSAAGREIIDIQKDHFWVAGKENVSIQITYVPNAPGVNVFSAHHLPTDLTGSDARMVAEALCTKYGMVRFFANYAHKAQRFAIMIDHFTSCINYLIARQLLMSVEAVEYYATSIDIDALMEHYFDKGQKH